MQLLHLIISIITVSNISLTAVETKIENSINLSELGIRYINKKSTEPIDNSIHILQINLKSKLVRPKVELGPDPDGEGPQVQPSQGRWTPMGRLCAQGRR